MDRGVLSPVVSSSALLKLRKLSKIEKKALDKAISKLEFKGGSSVPKLLDDVAKNLGEGESLSEFFEEAVKLGIKTDEGASAFSKIYGKLKNLPNGLKVQRVREGKDATKIAIIGTEMEERVKPIANELKKRLGHDVSIFDQSHLKTIMDKEEFKNFEKAQKQFNDLTKNGTIRLGDEAVKNTDLFKEDIKWIKRMRDEGYLILDIDKTKDSVWYKAECEVLGWKNYE